MEFNLIDWLKEFYAQVMERVGQSPQEIVIYYDIFNIGPDAQRELFDLNSIEIGDSNGKAKNNWK